MTTSITISYPCQLLSLSESHNSIPGDHAQNKILIIHVNKAKNCIVFIFAADIVNTYCYHPLSVRRITGPGRHVQSKILNIHVLLIHV
jgi:hypothetical protein